MKPPITWWTLIESNSWTAVKNCGSSRLSGIHWPVCLSHKWGDLLLPVYSASLPWSPLLRIAGCLHLLVPNVSKGCVGHEANNTCPTPLEARCLATGSVTQNPEITYSWWRKLALLGSATAASGTYWWLRSTEVFSVLQVSHWAAPDMLHIRACGSTAQYSRNVFCGHQRATGCHCLRGPNLQQSSTPPAPVVRRGPQLRPQAACHPCS